ncbi:phenylalanyl-tRNA synthetase beta subunit [Raineyella antarctica]|uniref:Phenylalanine--tRNA ligase beta subunit n=1 Tax=Raineyella antarctica TaxID=1577474 RepID=A0A1G6HCJ1_9ACTN|nr:phenylalanine--tRNA ligase subunit beta [Raineyella antarctica]SDB91999.1 phenylalanyl-tRNA synthetase beta subunit [Raineyella antarctica]
MKAPISWLREYVALPDTLDAHELATRLIGYGHEVERVESAGADVMGPVVVGRVLDLEKNEQKNGKLINWCHVDVGELNDPETGNRGIICGAHNFVAGDYVVVALPGAVLPGDFAIAARKTYGHVSDGMICSTSELGLGDDGTHGIIVLGDTDDAGRLLVPGQDAGPLLHLREDVLDIAVTPDMGYCLSIRGLAREAAEATGSSFTDVIDRDVPSPVSDGFPVSVEDPTGCPVFVALRLTGLDPQAQSPRWMRRRLALSGMRPISLGVDVTNYVMLETGQPLHAYDAATLQDGIVVRRARAGEKLTTLDGVVRTLDPQDLLITDGSGPIGLAGVMGGEHTELRETTTEVILESANFDALSMSRTARRHALGSEAARRNERGVDPNAAYAAAHRAAALLVEYGGATLDPAETVVGAVPVTPVQTIAVDLPSRILGTTISVADTIRHLEGGGTLVERHGGQLALVPPTWRPDLMDPYDYVEEVGRKVGLDSIEGILPAAPAGAGFTASQRARRALNLALPTAGFTEVLSFPFIAVDDLDRMGVPADDARRDVVTVANPLSDVQPKLRTTLLPGLFGAVARNTSRSLDDLALYEQGAIFRGTERPAAPRLPVDRRPSGKETAALTSALPEQPRHLACVLTGYWRRPGWPGAGEPVSWVHAAHFAETAAETVGLVLERRAAEVAPWHPGRCAELSVAGTVVGHAGELHPTVCEAYGLPARTCAAELDLDLLIALAPEGGQVASISSHPVAKEDVALVVDASVASADVEAALVRGAGDLLESVRLFDVYEGEQIPAGKKSLAYALRFRAADRTLKDKEAIAARDAAVAAAAELGAELRS